MASHINTKIQLRTDDLSNWTIANPILRDGELAIVRFDNDYKDIKIGNGISSFSQLPYLYQSAISADSITGKDLHVKSIAQGFNVKATPTSLVTGVLAEAEGNFNVVHGIEAKAKQGDDYAFVFNGTNLPGITERYQSHGEGTFNVNPLNGLSGFYIGEDSLSSILHNYFLSNEISDYYTKNQSNALYLDLESKINNVDNKLSGYYVKSETSSSIELSNEFSRIETDPFKTISLIKPYSENKLFLSAEVSHDRAFSSKFSIDSSVSNSCFYGFRDGIWEQQDISGFGIDFNNNPIEVDFREILSANDDIPTVSSQYYVRYSWYYNDSESAKHHSDIYSLILPTNTEVGANSRDVASKREFQSLYQNVIPEDMTAGKDPSYSQYYAAYMTKVNNFSDAISTDSKILLESYSKNANYRMKFTTASSDNDISVKFYVDYGNGPEYDSSLKINNNLFSPSTDYFIEVKNDCIVIDSINDRDIVNYVKNNSNSVTLRVWE